MKNIANQNPTAMLDSIAKFHRLLAKEGVTMEHISGPNNSVEERHNLAEYLKMGCPKMGNNDEMVINQLPGRHEQALSFLGKDYITPEEAAAADGTRYTDEQLKHFADTLPETQAILGFRTDKFLLIPGPVEELNLIQFQDRNNRLFFSKSGWHTRDDEKFARTDVVRAGEWLAIRKEEVPGSFKKTWSEQQSLLSEIEYVPNISEVVYTLAIYYKVRAIHLLSGKKRVRTSSVNTEGLHVDVGFYDYGIFSISNDHWNYSYRADIGILSARRIKH